MSTAPASSDESTPPTVSTTPSSFSPSSNSNPPSFNFNQLIPLASIELDPNNFLTWKKQVLPILKSNGLYKYVDSEFAPPSTHHLDATTNLVVPNPLFDQWAQMALSVMTWLNNTLSEPVFARTPTFSTSCELYQYLNRTFSAQNAARRHQFSYQLQHIQKLNQSVTEYIGQIRTIAEALASTNNPISNLDLVMHTLQGLGAEYVPFVTAIETRENLPTFSQLYPLLLNHEQRLLQHQIVPSDPANIAFIAKSQPSNTAPHQNASNRPQNHTYSPNRGRYRGHRKARG
ncbi:hypothetical protein BVC80_441g4 [Macleaya cordata]|uniref:Retrotransposon Copia-like N-terminal domain-containing protein n=1 Tax=Macleaya cordata TaxID=56857 RepID=A0A200Q465_MACCD|nr:hypothetical protein BVC80_441g4 [Macleaya cordata]